MKNITKRIVFILVSVMMLPLIASSQNVLPSEGTDIHKLNEYIRSVYDHTLMQRVDERLKTSKERFVVKVNTGVLLKGSVVPAAVAANKDDSLALVDLYNSTNGASWTDNTNWLTDSVYKWKGISLDENGRVTTIDLKANNLTGQLPASLGSLPNLEYLYFHDNAISGSIPVELGSLSLLKALYLSGNTFTGNIPVEIGSLADLKWLVLGSNNLSGKVPDELYQLTNLEFLDLSDNGLTGVISPAVSNLVNLKSLFFEKNEFEGPIPKELGTLVNLEQLALYRNKLSGSIPVELGNLTALRQLYLHVNSLTGNVPDELGQLVGLEYFYLSSNQLTGSFPAWIYGLTGLKELSLADNDFTGEIPAGISKLSSLNLLDLNYNRFSGSIPVELSKLTNLTALLLSDNEFEGVIPSELGTLTGLKELWLSSNDLIGDVPGTLNDLSDVYRLLLSENSFTSLPDLSALPLDSACFVQSNSFDFGDLETSKINFTAVFEYSYSPQAAVPLTMTENGDDVTLSVNVEGTNNEYHWFREGIIIDNEKNNSLTVKKVYAGEYFCTITNNDYPDLILASEKKTLYAYSVDFMVTDGQDPVVNAKVTLDGYGYEYTDASGAAVFSAVAPENDIAYTVTASGFTDVTGTLSVVDGDVHVDVEMSVPTEVDEKDGYRMEIYPNPTYGKVFVKSDEVINEIEVFDLTGELVLKKEGLGMNNAIDLTSLNKGLYMIIIHTTDKVYKKKVVIR
jgi:Leucine-rich repeat (LRR) protein